MGLNILLPFEQNSNPVIAGDHKLVHMKYFFTRKLMFVKESHAICLLPGGFGTLDELFEVATFAQLGHHDKPTVLLNAHGFFDGLIDYLDHAVALGLLRPEHRALLQVVDGLPAALSALEEPQSKT